MTERAVGSIGPSMVDLAFDMTKRERDYHLALKVLDTKPGGWKCIEDPKQFDEVMMLLIGQTLPATLEEILSLKNNQPFELIAGSSNLGTLVALSKHLRARSDFISSVGSLDGQTPDSLARYFTQSLINLGITHQYAPHKGKNPTGIVIGAQQETDKVLAMFPGVMAQLDRLPNRNYHPTLFQIDAYELRKDPIGDLIHKLITSNHYHISLGLGNTVILEGALRDKILRYINEERLTFLTGNESEFLRLFNIQNTHLTDTNYFQFAETLSIPHILITLGARGIVAIHEGKPYFQPSFPVLTEKIINTSGAGDTAAGVFISGILENKDIHTVLKETTYYASQVLKVHGSRLPNGR